MNQMIVFASYKCSCHIRDMNLFMDELMLGHTAARDVEIKHKIAIFITLLIYTVMLYTLTSLNMLRIQYVLSIKE